MLTTFLQNLTIQEAFEICPTDNQRAKKNWIYWCILQKKSTSSQQIFFILSRNIENW